MSNLIYITWLTDLSVTDQAILDSTPDDDAMFFDVFDIDRFDSAADLCKYYEEHYANDYRVIAVHTKEVDPWFDLPYEQKYAWGLEQCKALLRTRTPQPVSSGKVPELCMEVWNTNKVDPQRAIDAVRAMCESYR